jgi:hypothetical protein
MTHTFLRRIPATIPFECLKRVHTEIRTENIGVYAQVHLYDKQAYHITILGLALKLHATLLHQTLLTNSLHGILGEQPTGAQLLKNFPTFYGTRRLITEFAKVRLWSLSISKGIQALSPHPISLTSILVLSSQLRLGVRSGLFPSGVSTQTLHEFLLSFIRFIA